MPLRSATISTALALALSLWATPGRARADFVFDLDINTASIQGTQGYLDLQFNPTGGDGLLLATVGTFACNTTLESFTTQGNVSGTAFPLVFTADGTMNGQINEAFAAATFGSRVKMTVDLAAPDNISTASFQVTLYDSLGNPLLAMLSKDPNDPNDPSVIQLNMVANPGGTQPFVVPLVNSTYATATLRSVPEPGSFSLLAVALGCALGYKITRGKSRREIQS